MDYLEYLIVSLPPVFTFLLFVFAALLLYVALYFMFVFLESSPNLKFLLLDVDEMMANLFQPKPKPRRPQGRISWSYRTDPKNRYLQNDLLTLLKGDVATAKRLLAQARRKHPGKTDNWYLEKVIWDLERDRHR